jgi:hypothetical protein
MFSQTEKDLAAYLMTAERTCVERAKYNQGEAIRQLADIISNDRRFDGYDARKLAQRVSDYRHSGQILGLNDPELRRSGY